MSWKVQVFTGDTPQDYVDMGAKPEDVDWEAPIDFEVSVIREDNKHGQDSWGWGDDTKIILDVETKEFAIKAATLLCAALNSRK